MKAASATLAKRTSLRATAKVWNVFAERGSQINLVVLLLHQNLTNLFRHCIFSERFALRDALAIIANGFVFIIEIVSEHVSRFLGCAHRLGRDRWHLPQIVNLTRENQGMIEFLLGVDLKLRGDIHVFCAFEYLRIDYV